MSEVAVKIENLGKKFVIGHQRSGDLRYAFGQAVKGILQRTRHKQEFWALKDVNLQIRQGDVVGIIGRNGAGKSTLLKILSRITAPTTGRFEINGRVSSLLEVGTGFHFELTGRENIFLNGTLLGMRRGEIKNRFDEIVAFSGIESFIDTPVKHYSSGMKVRLAFSVAAHLEPEILIIDEVLAVGDAEFQKKCLGKMDEVSKKEGRTILFVSHNLAAVENLCSVGVLLANGEKASYGNVPDVIEKYLMLETRPAMDEEAGVPFSNGVCLKDFSLSSTSVQVFDSLAYSITIKSPGINRFSDLALLFYNRLNERIAIIDLRHNDLSVRSSECDEFTVRGNINAIPLMEGTYSCGLYVSSALCQGDFMNLKSFEVIKTRQPFLPYASKYRGYLEFDNSFVIV